jgi:hypothetical protein
MDRERWLPLQSNPLKTAAVIGLSLAILLCQFTCRKKSTGKLAPYPSSRLNPYQGKVKDILPEQVGDYKLVNTQGLGEIEQELVNPADGVGAIYNSSNNHTVQHMLVSFHSAVEANKELDNALKRYQDAHMKLRIEDVKDSSGQINGRRVIVNNQDDEAMNWTNGSLYCTAVSYTGYASEFAKNLPY